MTIEENRLLAVKLGDAIAPLKPSIEAVTIQNCGDLILMSSVVAFLATRAGIERDLAFAMAFDLTSLCIEEVVTLFDESRVEGTRH